MHHLPVVEGRCLDCHDAHGSSSHPCCSAKIRSFVWDVTTEAIAAIARKPSILAALSGERTGWFIRPLMQWDAGLVTRPMLPIIALFWLKLIRKRTICQPRWKISDFVFSAMRRHILEAEETDWATGFRNGKSKSAQIAYQREQGQELQDVP